MNTGEVTFTALLKSIAGTTGGSQKRHVDMSFWDTLACGVQKLTPQPLPKETWGRCRFRTSGLDLCPGSCSFLER